MDAPDVLCGTREDYEARMLDRPANSRDSRLATIRPGESVFLEAPFPDRGRCWRVYSSSSVWSDGELLSAQAPWCAMILLERGFTGGYEFRRAVLERLEQHWSALDQFAFRVRFKSMEMHRKRPAPPRGTLQREASLGEVIRDRYGFLLRVAGAVDDNTRSSVHQFVRSRFRPTSEIIEGVVRTVAEGSGLDADACAAAFRSSGELVRERLGGFGLWAWYEFFWKTARVPAEQLVLGLH